MDKSISDNVDVRLEDVPELGYLTSDKPFPRGEIVVKTKYTINSYYKDQTATYEASL